MHDIKAIRDNPDFFDMGLARRGLSPMAADLLAIDAEKREYMQKLQDAQAVRNEISKGVGEAIKAGDKVTADELKSQVSSLKDLIASGEARQRRLNQKLTDALALIPNIPLGEVPNGENESDNVEVRRWGEATNFPFPPRQHFDLGEWLGLMDFETAAKLAGARFVVLKGQLARLERALASFMLDLHTTNSGYTEHIVPLLVRDSTLYGTGQLPKFEEDLFFTDPRSKDFETDTIQQIQARVKSTLGEGGGPFTRARVDQIIDAVANNAASAFMFSNIRETEDWGNQASLDAWPPPLRFGLIPTAEVSLTNLVREQILEETKLPLRFTAWTPCFRAEAGAAGRDTRGMIRQHQFSKVELVSITTPEQSREELERMTGCAEEVLKRLGLHYRVVKLCAGDMGFASRMTYDIEVWLPGQNAFREISSCSVCGEFQARRMEARYKPADGKGTRYVHTLNGSGLAVGRTLIAVLENYQNADGSVTIPDVLRPYMGGQDRITRP